MLKRKAIQELKTQLELLAMQCNAMQGLMAHET